MVEIPARFQKAVRDQQIEFVYRTIKVQLIANPVVAGCVIFLLYGKYPLQNLLIWFGMLLAVFSTRYWLYRKFWKAKELAEESDIDWGRLFAISNVLGGLAWGYVVFEFYSPEHYVESSMLLVIIAGFIAGTFGSHSAYYPSFVIFSSTSLAFIVLRLIMIGGKIEIIYIFLILVYYVSLLIYARTAQDHAKQAIVMRLQVEELNDELVKQRKQLVLAKETAEKANQAKSRFLASASHDLRQPLHALRLFVDILESRVKEPSAIHVVDKVMSTTDVLEDLFSNLLELSKVDAKVTTPQYESIALFKLLRGIMVEVEPLAANKGLNVRLHCANELYVTSDMAKLSRIVRNLVINAIRYTEKGGILVGCRIRGRAIRIEVWDTGIGIAEKDLARIFEEFHQIHNPERDRSQGLGLGLAISERLAAMLGTKVEVRSRVGRGSCFSISVPAASATPHTLPTLVSAIPDSHSISGLRVVFIDDESDIREAMSELFESWGCGYVVSETLEMALEKLQTWNSPPDVIVTDYRLRKGALGTEVIKMLRAHYGQHIPAIIVTGDTSQERLQDAVSSGASVLHKPIKALKLRMLIEQLSVEARKKTA